MAASLVVAVTQQEAQITSPKDAGKLLQFVNPLMTDAPGTAVDADAAAAPRPCGGLVASMWRPRRVDLAA